MKIFVINAYADRTSKYDENYEMFPAYWWEDIDDEKTDMFSFRWNCKSELRKKICACTLSHLEMIKKIVLEDLKEIVICEDDCMIDDIELLKETIHLLPKDELTYLGGQINSPLVKDYRMFEKTLKRYVIDKIKNDNKLIHTIDVESFRITHCCCYYIPNKQVAQNILDSIQEIYSGTRKMRAIDVAFHELQKRKIITKFVFPAQGILHIPDAKKGYTYSTYKLTDNQKEY
jgi:GR25 family glycosyltransferase involved in LPS biosynthesis